jgi:hypothetical protein
MHYPVASNRETALNVVIGMSCSVRFGMEWLDDEQEREGGTARPADGVRARAGKSGRVERGDAATGGLRTEKVEFRAGSEDQRIFELEMENLRLTRLVADLLLKNQRLRESN